jgi:hypothetical protein
VEKTFVSFKEEKDLVIILAKLTAQSCSGPLEMNAPKSLLTLSLEIF